ncbi:MAG: hypothetical protein HC844_12640 [Tabrizicola sp.]|nr:hypothetical protein [Tabrizicola sp.]
MARRFSSKRALGLILAAQIGLAALLMGRDLAQALPRIALPSFQPAFDRPVSPGDQTRRFQPRNTPLSPPGDGNPDRPYQNTGDMPDRLQFEVKGDTLILTGFIDIGDAERFTEELARTSLIRTLRLNSPGGSVTDALMIGRAVRDAGLDTALAATDICLSACPYILAGGVARSVHPEAQVGVHQHSFGESTVLPAFLAIEDVQRGQGEVMAYLDGMGIDLRLMQHALTTPPDEIYVLLPRQVQDYGLTTATGT